MTDHLHGPRFVAWLEANGLFNLQVQLKTRHCDAVRRWKGGETASFYDADEVLTVLGLTEAEIPAGLWVEAPRSALVTAILREQAALWRGLCRKYTQTPQDAEDALQQATEIALEKIPLGNPPYARKWFNVVLRRECFKVSKRTLPWGSLDNLADSIDLNSVVEAREQLDEVGQLREPQRIALLDRIAGFSYKEITERHGWTYTKTNRSLVEGRQALRAGA